MSASTGSPASVAGGERPSPLKVWWLAARPKTLPASIAPILVGTGVAIHEDGFHALTAFMALLTALLLQIAANFANDALDFKRGTDTPDRTGPTRITAMGYVTPEAVLRATAIALALAVASGLYLVWRGGWPFLLIGVLAVISAVAYTGGPWPLAYLGLGEVFVFLFFGLAAVTGTAYLQTLDLTALSLLAAVPMGLMAICILIVNNVRDLEGDRRSGKHTIAVRIGDAASRKEYVLLQQGVLAFPFFLWLGGWLDAWALLTVLAWPLFWRLWRQIGAWQGARLNATLAGTGQATLAYSILFTLALVLA